MTDARSGSPAGAGTRSRRAERSDPASVGRAVAQFGASALAALLVIALLGIYALTRVSNDEAVREAQRLTRVVAEGIVQPVLTDSLVRGSRRAVDSLDRVVGRRVLVPPVVRVKIWTSGGRIVYSDKHRLIGSRYSLGDEEQAALGAGEVDAELSDLARPENRFERSQGKLLEVYLPVVLPDGHRLLFETYQRYDSIASSGRHVWQVFAPVVLAALILLAIAQLPLAWRMARSLRATQQEREKLLRRAIEASEGERRRIAGDLHDGVVQDLVGVSYALAGAAEVAARDEPSNKVAQTLRDSAGKLRSIMRQMRSLLVDIYPPSLHAAGLEAVVADLASPLLAQDIEVDIDYPTGLRLDDKDEMLFFRVAQEALRNVLTHSGATRVTVHVSAEDHSANLIVRDNGRGFSGSEWARRANEGHVGLRLLQQLAAEEGGRMTIDSASGRGTEVRLSVGDKG